MRSEILRRTRLLLAAVLLLPPAAGAAGATGAAGAAAGQEGSWEGVMVIRPGELELDLGLDVEREGDGWAAYLSVPTRGLRRQRLEAVRVEGDRLGFVYKDASGDSAFAGRLAADGRALEGEFTESGQAYAARFERASRSAEAEPAFAALSAGGDELRQAFNRHKDATRLVMIGSPTCHSCKVATRVVRRYVLQALPEEKVHVFVVWEPHLSRDGKDPALEAAKLVPDPRVTHFWSPDTFAGKAFQESLGLQAAAWDIVLVFPPGEEWGAKPAFYMHNRPESPLVPRLDGAALAQRVKSLAKAGAGAAAKAGS